MIPPGNVAHLGDEEGFLKLCGRFGKARLETGLQQGKEGLAFDLGWFAGEETQVEMVTSSVGDCVSIARRVSSL